MYDELTCNYNLPSFCQEMEGNFYASILVGDPFPSFPPSPLPLLPPPPPPPPTHTHGCTPHGWHVCHSACLIGPIVPLITQSLSHSHTSLPGPTVWCDRPSWLPSHAPQPPPTLHVCPLPSLPPSLHPFSGTNITSFPSLTPDRVAASCLWLLHTHQGTKLPPALLTNLPQDLVGITQLP